MKLDKSRIMHLLEYAILLPGAGFLIGGSFGLIGYFIFKLLHFNYAYRKLFFVFAIILGVIFGIIGAIDFIYRAIKAYNIIDNEKKPEEIKDNAVK